jgi:hypothetical protein
MATLTDPHLSLVRPVTPRTPGGCEECLILGSEWVHLRLCLTCGHVGCCDSSPLRHARAHASPSGTRSSSRSSRARTGAGAMSTKPSSEEAPETPDLQRAYPRLSDAQIAALDAQGRRRPTGPGDVLFAEGERECDFFIVLAGRMASVEGKGMPEERVIAVHGRGRFFGELSLLTGEGACQGAMAIRLAFERTGPA